MSSGSVRTPGQPPAIERARRAAGRVLWIEQIWPALLPALALVVAFLILSLLTVPQRLPAWLHALLLLCVLGTIGWLLQRRLRPLRTPSPDRRDRRIEQATRLPHHPLSALTDRPAREALAGDPAILLWQAHLRRLRDGLPTLTAGRPRLGLLHPDRLRVGLPMLALLLLALLFAGRDAPLRIASGLWPGLAVPLGPKPLLQAWITPPDYAGGAPIFLTDPHGRYEVAAGASLTLSLTGLGTPPAISFRGQETGAARAARLSPTSWSAGRVLSASSRISVDAAGYRLADWSITVQPVLAPVVSWASPPGPAVEEPPRTRLPWAVTQRYGVRTLAAELRLANAAPGQPDRVLRVPIPLSGAPTAAHGVALPDLSADPWAGAAVIARLVATDAAGQTGRSAQARFVLPARLFRNPLARAVLDVRRRLALGREQPAEAADDLQALGDTPGEFAQDSSLFLNLNAVASLLRLQTGRLDEPVDRLWELALALEDGLHNDRAGARAALEVRAAQDRLAAQLEHMRQLGDRGQSPAEQDELRARIAALGAAIAQRMQALAAQAARDHTTLPPMPDQKMLGGQDLSRMLQQMRDAAASGHPQDAARMLSQMQAMLDHMRAATPQDLQSAREQAAARQQAQQQMGAVQDLVQRQTKLLDHAQARQNQAAAAAAQAADSQQPGADGSQPGLADGAAMDPATAALMRQLGITPPGTQPNTQPGTQPAPTTPPPASPATPQPGQARADGHMQHVLHRALDELSTEFNALTGKKAGAFDEAGRAMDRAHDALAAGQDAPAVQAQMQALAALQKGAQQMRDAMSSGGSGSGGGMALLPGSGPSGPGSGSEPGQEDADEPDSNGQTDPLGRHLASGHSGMDDGGDTHVPENEAPARSREIEQELRRRDGDRTRPQPELDYLDRLLKSF